MKKFRLTPMQEAMLYEVVASSTSRYVTVLRYKLTEGANAAALKRRAGLLTERHEALRTAFVRDKDGLIWQEVSDRAEVDFSVADSFKSICKEQARISPFHDKLFRLILCPDELIVIFHHVLLDGWSVGVIMRELLAEEEPSGKASPFRYYMKWLSSRDYSADLAWWKGYLNGVKLSELPNAAKTDEYERRELRFTIEKSALLRDTARDLRITAGRLLQAVWCMLLARYNGGESLVCTVVSGRSAPVPGITGMVGMCVNTLPIVTRLPKPPDSVTFAKWVYEWSRQAAEAEKHGYCSLGDLISQAPPHILSVDPSFDGEGFRLKTSSAKLVTGFDAAFTLSDDIRAEFAYNSFIYTDETMKAIQGHFMTLLNTVLENPEIAIEKIHILTGLEIAELTAHNENAEILNILKTKTVVDFWRESAKKNANRTALVCGESRLTYAGLSKLAEKQASALRVKGVCADSPVAILLPRSERYVAAELAVLTAGGMFIPLDPEWPQSRIDDILDETKPHIVIDENVFEELCSFDGPLLPEVAPKPHDAAYMIMTSGTTGAPKGVVVEHRSFANFCLWAKERYGWKSGDSSALELGCTFDGSLWDIWLPLISGGAIHVLPDDVRFNIGAIGDYCRANRITHIDLPVTMAEAFLEIYGGENTLPDLRVMVTGGEEVRRVLPAPYALSNEYGPTECTVCCSAGWLNEGDSPITAGSPPPNMNVYILDDWGQRCPDGVTGEAYFSGVQVARGYYNSPELTAARFMNNPFAGGNQNHSVIYRTGDLMKIRKRGNNRELVFIGRMDDMVKINGYRIELGEIENVLRGHGTVNAVTAAVQETSAGEKRLCAYVVPNGALDVSELHGLIKAKLPTFMRPVIFLVDKIPLNSSGKVDLKQLSFAETGKTAENIPPKTENEKVLVSVISRLLGVNAIGTNNSYTELGGNSINAMRISFYLEKDGYELNAKQLISSASLKEAASKMRSVTLVQPTEYSKSTFTPLGAQQAMIFLAETAGSSMYTVTLTLDAPGLDIQTLGERLERAAKLHDILRAAFEVDESGKITGRILNAHRIPVNEDGLETANGINPLKDPLVSLQLQNDKLTLRYHHIALDGFSVNLLIDELLFDKFPETAPSFAVFANRLAAKTDKQAEDEAWWRENCRDAKIARLLPPKTAVEPEYRRITFCSPGLLANCAGAARRARVTPAAFALAAWSVVVNTLSDGDCVIIPFVASCRDDGNLMGMCAETRPLMFRRCEETFGELAASVQDAILASVSHWFTPQDIIGKLQEYLFVFEDGTSGFTASGEQNYDLVVKFSDRGELIYNSSRLSEDGAKCIAVYLETALKSAVDNRVSALPEAEHTLVTQAFARGWTLAVNYKTAAEAFAAAAVAYSEHIALETDMESFTYSELYRLAKSLADRLNAQDIGKGDVVAFKLPRNAEGIIAQLGIALSGAAFLPLDPAWPENRTVDILNDSGAIAVIECGLNIALTGANGKVPPDTAYIIYTSGTSGRPKGVILPQAALANQIEWALDEFGYTPADKMLHYIAFTFDPSVWVLFTALASGAVLSLLPEAARLDPDACVKYIEDKSVTICTFPAAVAPDILHRVKTSDLRVVFLGGEAPKNLPHNNREYEIINLYGPTEACVNAAFHRLPPNETETCVIGSPVANTDCYVLDVRGEPCPIGIQGELCIGGVQLAHGYLNRADESASAFAEHPRFGRIYKTGDRAAWNADGTLTFHGRADSQVKIRGNRVELSEIEHVLREFPGVSDAKVLYRDGIPDAYIIAREPVLSAELKMRLPSYMLPRSVTVMEKFPLTENGKIDVDAFPKAAKDAAENIEPLTEMESAIADAWKTALGLREFSIGRGDNFYDLGGHSLLLFHVVGRLSANGINADIRTLIEHPVLADLAEAVSRAKTVQSPKPAESHTENSDEYSLYVRKMQEIELSGKRFFRNILITGGTGFLGSHLVREFYINTNTKIHLPIRGDITRLRDTLNYYFGELSADMAASSRIRAYTADIAEKPPDIDAPLDAIFHTAADIRHYAPEAEMYRANVAGTKNVLTLAERCPSTLFAHISTTSAVNAPVIRETDTEPGPEFDNIYQRTKQLAEQMVLDAGKRGLKYAVFRVGHVSPGYESGSVARNWEINAMLRLINAMLLTELLPEQDYKIGYGYVDKTAQAIRLLSTPENLSGYVFHIDNPNTLRLSELFKLAGLAGTVLPRDELCEKLRGLSAEAEKQVRRAASEYLGRLSQGRLEKDSSDIVAGELHMDATLLLLKRLGFNWPYVTEEYMKRLVAGIRNRGGE